MERDLDLIREILISLTRKVHSGPSQMLVRRYSPEVINFHCQLLHDQGYIISVNLRSGSVLPRELTQKGREFAEGIRDYKIWDRAMEKGLTGSLDEIKEVVVKMGEVNNS